VRPARLADVPAVVRLVDLPAGRTDLDEAVRATVLRLVLAHASLQHGCVWVEADGDAVTSAVALLPPVGSSDLADTRHAVRLQCGLVSPRPAAPPVEEGRRRGWMLAPPSRSTPRAALDRLLKVALATADSRRTTTLAEVPVRDPVLAGALTRAGFAAPGHCRAGGLLERLPHAAGAGRGRAS
jgi:hypothetical protein